ncbi:MAG: DUF4175 domain-containing protein [Candidatus Gastranaerophilales bacterium]|nr:DUF4175 domain-containing protein [Candidatus Gastranaerophilales bacterium]
MSMTVSGIGSNRTKPKTTSKTTTSRSGSISIQKAKQKKKKKLNYNLKRISTQILMSKTSNTASKAAVSARSVVSMLQRKLRTGDYNDLDVERALVHAKKMERIAKKRVKHMREEERAAKTGSCIVEGENEDTLEMQKENKESDTSELSAKEIEQMMRELEELMQEAMQETLDDSLRDMAEELMGASQQDLDPEALERLKKKHRASELQEIVRADMEYLKALFDKLAKEKQSSSNGSSASQSAESNNISGVTLQLAGADIPVDVPETPVVTEGANVDVLV